MFFRHRATRILGLLAILSIPAVFPFLRDQVPRTNDLASHVYRAFELEQLLRAGVIFPRWGPHLVHGYGYPVFNYFPYLSHYLITITHLASGLDFLWSYRIVTAVVTLVTAWGTFLFGRDLFKDESAGVLAAIGFVYSPYLLMTANVRGGLPESLALAALSFGLWTWSRIACGERRFVMWAGLTYAILILSHNGSAVQISPILFVYAVWRGRSQIRLAISQIAIAAIIGVGLTAFYWLPALVELQYVQVASGYASTGIVYHQNFTPVSGLFKYPFLPIDSDLLNPIVSSPLPIVTLIFSGLTIWRARLVGSKHFSELMLLSLISLIALFLVLPQSRLLWDLLPLLQLTLWPWRFIGPASLMISILAAGLMSTIFKNRTTYLIIGVFAVMLNGLPWLYPPREALVSPTNVADLARFEMPPWLIGTSTTAEYLPQWVQQLPDTDEQREVLLTNSDPDRLDRQFIPPGVKVQHVANEILSDTYKIITPDTTELTFKHFFFPGWRAWIDNNPVPIVVSQPHGLIKVTVPSGEHLLMLSFGPTSVRYWSGMFSLVSLLTVVVFGFSFSKVRPGISSRSVNEKHLVIFAVLVVIAFILSVIFENPVRKHGLINDNRPLQMQKSIDIDFGSELWLHGYSLSNDSIAADDVVELDLFWQAQRNIGLVYGFNVRLRDLHGRLWNTSEIVRPRGWRFMPGTDFWPPDKYVIDKYAVRPLSGTPPGTYHLEVIAFRQDTLEVLNVSTIGVLQIVSADNNAFADIEPLAVLENGRWLLRDFLIDRIEAVSGEIVGIQAVWSGIGSGSGPYQARISMLDRDRKEQASFDFEIGVDYPPSEWKSDEAVRDQYIARVPADLPSGQYSWYVKLVSPEGHVLGEYEHANLLRVNVPERLFDKPYDLTILDVELGNVATLSGYNMSNQLTSDGGILNIQLVWEANVKISESYHVFVHIIDESGNLVAQSDGEPASWTRPTTGWLPGEYIVDDHEIVLPTDIEPGSYIIYTGLYNNLDQQRLISDEFSDGSVRITEISYGDN
jgi:hypothetical protein